MRLSQVCATVLWLTTTSTLAAPEHMKKAIGGPDLKKAEAIKEAYRVSWKGYYDYAFPNDTLRPVTKGYENDRNAWGVTAIDSLSTAIVLGDRDSVNQILEFIPTIDFTTTAQKDQEISLFETNIRYFGGLLSAHDLLTRKPYSDLVQDPTLVKAILKQAVSLADSIKFAFDTPSGIPDPTIILNPKPRLKGSTRNNIAEIGTLVLEWTHLTHLTGDPTYAHLAQRAESHLLRPQPPQSEPFPGLTGTWVNIASGEFEDAAGGWGAYRDSFYEYLIKMYLYDPVEFAGYRDRWVEAADSTMEVLASRPTVRKDLMYLCEYQGKQRIPTSSHLASFSGGNFILGGILLNEQKYIDFGLSLTTSYYSNYASTLTHIGPESFRWTASELPLDPHFNKPPPTPSHASFYAKAGFWAESPSYILRPETVESLYYAYRATKDGKYQRMAWEAFEAMRRVSLVVEGGVGFAGVRDVTVEGGGGYIDKMESFWIAETLKYLYLIFAEEGELQVSRGGGGGRGGKKNKWVYNTEAHPLRVK